MKTSVGIVVQAQTISFLLFFTPCCFRDDDDLPDYPRLSQVARHCVTNFFSVAGRSEFGGGPRKKNVSVSIFSSRARCHCILSSRAELASELV